jgi:hypothetical protein
MAFDYYHQTMQSATQLTRNGTAPAQYVQPKQSENAALVLHCLGCMGFLVAAFLFATLLCWSVTQ